MIRAGLRGESGPQYVLETCILADHMQKPPSYIEDRWGQKDRQLMLAYYQVKAEIENGKQGR